MHNCPHTYFGLAGYSQGAQVVREAFAQMNGPEQLRVCVRCRIR